MQAEVVVAIVAACGSLVVAGLSLASSLMTGRSQARSQESLESFKANLARQEAAAKRRNDDKQAQLDALQTSIRAIQEFRDHLQLALTSADDGLRLPSALKQLEERRERIFVCYQESLAILGQEEKFLLHKAKNQALSADQIAHLAWKDLELTSKMEPSQRLELLEIRAELGDVLDKLRDIRSDTFMELVRG
jgi:hypothetical protein